MAVRIINGDCRERLRELPDASAHCVVTSPPYFGLRDYGVAGQIGLEDTPDAFVAEMVAVFREVRRVLRDDGVLWLNLGDSYANNQVGGLQRKTATSTLGPNRDGLSPDNYMWQRPHPSRSVPAGLKPKDLIGIPWRVAFALQADGWWLRQDIIWHKPNPMPESVTDRCTKAHETIFLLTKSPRYYFDAAAISERVSQPGVVEGPDLAHEVGAFGQNLGLHVAETMFPGSAPLVGAGHARGSLKASVRLAASILNLTEPQDNLGLLPFDPQVRQQRADDLARALIRSHPVIGRASAQASRFADGDIPPEQFLQELHGLWVALPDGDDLKEAWRFAFLNVGHINADSDGTIGVNDPGEVSKVEIVHGEQDTRTGSGSRKLKRASGDVYTAKAFAHPQSEPRGSQSNFGDFATRNRRSVWTVATQPFSEAHFATFPPALIEPCILAGCPTGGTVLDPFGGAGTTGLVADRLGRDAILIELNPEYADMARKRIGADAGMFAAIEAA